jgi:hypothetical protein
MTTVRPDSYRDGCGIANIQVLGNRGTIVERYLSTGCQQVYEQLASILKTSLLEGEWRDEVYFLPDFLLASSLAFIACSSLLIKPDFFPPPEAAAASIFFL